MSAAGVARLQSTIQLLVVSPDDEDRLALRQILQEVCRLHWAAGRRDAVRLVQRYHPTVAICQQVFADGDWRDLLEDLQDLQPVPRLIVSSRIADCRLWAEVLNLGAYDLLAKPFSAAEVCRIVRMAARQ